MSVPRKFDWDEAQRLRDSGLTYVEIGKRLGVSDSAVSLACNPEQREAAIQRTAEWQRQGVCVTCGGKCTRTGGQPLHRCITCSAIAKATTARDGELRCGHCHEWKPDAAYPRNRMEKIGRRGRHGCCRGCQTELRRRSRHNRRVPCTSCGEPCAHPDDSRSRTGFCQHCSRARRRAA